MLPLEEAVTPLGADSTKYDQRHVRDKIAVLHRAAIALLALVAVVTIFGDGLMVRSKLRKQQSSTFHLVRGERVRSRFDPAATAPPEVVDSSEAERLAREEEAERARLEAKRSADLSAAAKNGLADTWGGADAEGEEGDGHNSAEEHRHGRRDAGPVAAAVNWQLTPAAECGGYFGNGYSDFQPLVGGSSGPGGYACPLHPLVTVTISWSTYSLRLVTAVHVRSQSAPRAGGEPLSLSYHPLPSASGEYLWCRGHPGSKAYYCRAHSLLVNPSAVSMSQGGEALGDVMGRSEDAELPKVRRREACMPLSVALTARACEALH